MKKRVQIILNDDVWKQVEATINEANKTFDVGSITYSDVINEMILDSKIDIKTLQLKHTDFRRSLKLMARKEDLDLDGVIKSLMELKSKNTHAKNSPTKRRNQTNEHFTQTL